MYYHFSYTSGGNPYIAKTETERDRIIKKHETAGDKLAEVSQGYYLIDDKHFFNSWPIGFIKVNLPISEQDYNDAAGEGVWVIVSAEVKAAHDNDETGTSYTGILDNDSFDYIGLEHGAIIPFEMRGDHRPVVPYSWLTEHYKINKEFFKGTPQYDYL